MVYAFSSIFFSFWGISCIATGVVAAYKKRDIFPWVLIAILFGPFALLMVSLLPKNEPQGIKPPNISDSSTSVSAELKALKGALSLLTERLHNLELKINASPSQEETQVPAFQDKPEIKIPVNETQKETPKEKQDIEANIGKYWLNKIGITLFSLGIAFLITYTFRYFGAAMRIAFGYVVGAGLFFLGTKLEKKDKLANYGRIILGGAWAIIYFTTYAMYHFQASKIIHSRPADLLLLGIVCIGMLLHSLKYRSEALSATALFVGYLTATMGDVSYSTFISCVLLAIIALILVYKMQWVNFIFVGIILTYLTHFFWVGQHIYFPYLASKFALGHAGTEEVYFLVSAGFLSTYWVLFGCGIHLLKNKTDAQYNKLSAANFFNAFLFFFMVYPQLSYLYPVFKFFFVFGLGALYLGFLYLTEKLQSKKLFTSDIIIALSFLTLAVPLKLMPFYTSLTWMIELPFLLALGLIFERRVIRYFCLCLALFLFLKMLVVDFTRGGYVYVFDLNLEWVNIISFSGFVSMAACFYLARFFKKKQVFNLEETGLYNFFSALATIYLVILTWRVVDFKLLTLCLSFGAFAIFYLGILLLDKYLRVYALMLFSIVFFRFSFIDDHVFSSDLLNWVVAIFEMFCLYAVYFLYNFKMAKILPAVNVKVISAFVFWAATIMVVCTIYRYIVYSWISLGLGVAGVVMFAAGFLIKDKIFRWSGFLIFALTIMRVIFVDLAMLHVIYKIISFVVIGILFLAISYLYTKNIDRVQKQS